MVDFKNGLIQKLAQTDNSKYSDKLNPMLVSGEEIVFSFKSIRDGVVFTNKRIFTINVQGLTGKKIDYSSLPYSKIQAFSVETAGLGDLDTELELWFSGLGKVKLEFSSNVDIIKISKMISDLIL